MATADSPNQGFGSRICLRYCPNPAPLAIQQSPRACLCLIGLLGLLHGLAVGASQVEFEVGGEAVYDLHSSKGETEMSLTNLFSVSVLGSDWRIATWYPGSSNRLECARVGQCLRTVYSEYRPGTTNSHWANSASVKIRDSPDFDNQFLQTLWLAFCSADYLRNATNGMIEPIWTQDDPTLRQEGFRVSGRWALNESAPFLPISVIYLNDGVYRGYNAMKQEPIRIVLAPPYQAGYTSAVYFASNWTNTGVAVPLHFFFRTFHVPLSRGVTPDMPRDTMFGHVKEVATRGINNLMFPSYRGPASIHDYRIPANVSPAQLPGGFATYKANDGRWPEGQERESLIYEYIRKVASRNPTAHRPMPSSKRWWVLTGLVVTTVVPIFFLGRAIRNKSRKEA